MGMKADIPAAQRGSPVVGLMTASDMEALFKPVPFGDTGHRSALTQAAAPDLLPVWDLFRSVDEDKQNVTIQVAPPPHPSLINPLSPICTFHVVFTPHTSAPGSCMTSFDCFQRCQAFWRGQAFWGVYFYRGL